MNNKKIIIAVAAGVAAVTVAGILLAKKNKSTKAKLIDAAGDYSDDFSSKLNSLKRKAKKEFKSAYSDGEDFANKAKDRATHWVNKAGANL